MTDSNDFDSKVFNASKKEMDELSVSNAHMDERIKSCERRTEKLEHSIYGNGRIGLKERADIAEGSLTVIKWLVGSSFGVTLISILLVLISSINNGVVTP